MTWPCSYGSWIYNKTYHHDITEILLKVALNTIKPNQTLSWVQLYRYSCSVYIFHSSKFYSWINSRTCIKRSPLGRRKSDHMGRFDCILLCLWFVSCTKQKNFKILNNGSLTLSFLRVLFVLRWSCSLNFSSFSLIFIFSLHGLISLLHTNHGYVLFLCYLKLSEIRFG